MTDLLSKAILEGHQAKIFAQIIEKLVKDKDYEDYITRHIQ